MKICPKCQTEYDEDVIRFCTKDGSPLVDKTAPDFSDKMPSEAPPEPPPVEDDEGEKTIIRRKAPSPQAGTQPLTPADAQPADNKEKSDSKRMVISTSDEGPKNQGVRPKAAPVKKPEPKKSNTAVIVLMSIIGTLIVMLGAFGVYWYLTLDSDPDANSNLNINENVNEGTENFNSDDIDLDNLNGNFEDNTNSNSNSNANANLSTPTPSPTKTPTPSPSPSPSVSPSPTGDNTNSATPTVSPTATTTATPTPAPTKTPTPTPKPSPPSNSNTPVNVGTVNGRARSLPVPSYPSSARSAKATGRVNVAVVIDRNGNVVSARAVSGHPLLRASAVAAARRSKFRPVVVNGRTVRARGTIQYNFKN